MITRLAISSVTQGLPKYRSMLAGNTLISAFESIASATGTGSSATITFSSIPQTYQHLQIRIIGRTTNTGSSVNNLEINPNGVTSGFAVHKLEGNGSTVTASGSTGMNGIYCGSIPQTNFLNSSTYGVSIIDIHDYASTTKNKTIRSFYGVDGNTSGGVIDLGSTLYISTSAITSISFGASANNFATGTTFALYGIRGA